VKNRALWMRRHQGVPVCALQRIHGHRCGILASSRCLDGTRHGPRHDRTQLRCGSLPLRHDLSSATTA
jgi:hypothetical protein